MKGKKREEKNNKNKETTSKSEVCEISLACGEVGVAFTLGTTFKGVPKTL